MIIDATAESLTILTCLPFVVGVAIGLAWERVPSQPERKPTPLVSLPFADKRRTR